MQDFLIYHRPRTGLKGKCSMEYCLAASLLHGRMGLAHFADASIQEARGQDLMHEVRLIHPEELPTLQPLMESLTLAPEAV